MTLADEILAMQDRKTVTVVIPEWANKTITIRAFCGKERDAWEQLLVAAQRDKKPVVNLRAQLAAIVVVDETGKLAFSPDQVEALGAKSGKALDRIFDAFMKLNALSEEEIKDYEKNS